MALRLGQLDLLGLERGAVLLDLALGGVLDPAQLGQPLVLQFVEAGDAAGLQREGVEVAALGVGAAQLPFLTAARDPVGQVVEVAVIGHGGRDARDLSLLGRVVLEAHQASNAVRVV
ncbi:hypothetical protein GCM10020219_044830 [Nonomuraea dietziae]